MDESTIALPLVRIFIDEVEDYPEVNVVFGIHVGAGLGVLVVHHTVVTELPVAVGGREADSGKSVPQRKILLHHHVFVERAKSYKINITEIYLLAAAFEGEFSLVISSPCKVSSA